MCGEKRKKEILKLSVDDYRSNCEISSSEAVSATDERENEGRSSCLLVCLLTCPSQGLHGAETFLNRVLPTLLCSLRQGWRSRKNPNRDQQSLFAKARIAGMCRFFASMHVNVRYSREARQKFAIRDSKIEPNRCPTDRCEISIPRYANRAIAIRMHLKLTTLQVRCHVSLRGNVDKRCVAARYSCACVTHARGCTSMCA